jgi:hypothetical protein
MNSAKIQNQARTFPESASMAVKSLGCKLLGIFGHLTDFGWLLKALAQQKNQDPQR